MMIGMSVLRQNISLCFHSYTLSLLSLLVCSESFEEVEEMSYFQQANVYVCVPVPVLVHVCVCGV